MRKRILILPAVLALTVGLVAAANGAVTSQTIKGQATPAKQFAKQRGGVTIRVDTDAAFDDYSPPDGPSSHAERAVIHFDNDFVFNIGNLPGCNRAQIENTPTETAKQVCGSAQVGAGGATTDGALGPIPAVVTAFNGAPAGAGSQVILLHARVGPPINATTILEGHLELSELGGDYGRQLDVAIQPLGGGFQVITHFDTTVDRRVVKKGKRIVKKNKRTGKKKVIKKPALFYVSARCRDADKTWNFAGDFYFVDNPGGGTENVTKKATATQQCAVKKVKKKKKKRKKKRNRR